MVCFRQGIQTQWHDHIRDWLARWIVLRTGVAVWPEPWVPEWNYPVWVVQGGVRVQEERKARLDGGFIDTKGHLVYYDVTIVTASGEGSAPDELALRASTDGAAAIEACRGKRQIYRPDKHPRARLIPFALEARGRASGEAVQFLQSMAPTDPSERAIVMRSAYQQLSTLVAMREAEILMASEGVCATKVLPRTLTPARIQ